MKGPHFAGTSTRVGMPPEAIRQARTDYELTQDELSKLLGVHAITISKWERGTAPPSKVPASVLLHMRLVTLTCTPKVREQLRAQIHGILREAETAQALLVARMTETVLSCTPDTGTKEN